jgi:hypothetical protein
MHQKMADLPSDRVTPDVANSSLSSRSAPTKFVPLSERITSGIPLRDINRLIALMQESVSREFAISKCTALTFKQVNMTIIGANTIIKGIVSKCVICRKYQAPIMHQKMADLPSDRVTPDVAPFILLVHD